MKFSFLFLALVMASSQVLALDVSPVDDTDTRYVKVTLRTTDGRQEAKFEFCNSVNEQCKPIGQKEFYSLEELRSKRFSQQLKSLGVAGISFVIVVGAAYGGIYGGCLLGASIAQWPGCLLGGFVGVMGAPSVAMALLSDSESLNTSKQYKMSWVLKEEVITDSSVKSADIGIFVKRLKTILD